MASGDEINSGVFVRFFLTQFPLIRPIEKII